MSMDSSSKSTLLLCFMLGFWAVMRHSSRSSMTAFVLISEPRNCCSCPARQNTSCLALCSPIQHQLPVVYSVHAFGLYQQEQGLSCVQFVRSTVSSDQQVLLGQYSFSSVRIVYWLAAPQQLMHNQMELGLMRLPMHIPCSCSDCAQAKHLP